MNKKILNICCATSLLITSSIFFGENYASAQVNPIQNYTDLKAEPQSSAIKQSWKNFFDTTDVGDTINFSKDGKNYVILSNVGITNQLQLFDSDTGKQIWSTIINKDSYAIKNVAYDSKTHSIFITDKGNIIRKVDVSTGKVSDFYKIPNQPNTNKKVTNTLDAFVDNGILYISSFPTAEVLAIDTTNAQLKNRWDVSAGTTNQYALNITKDKNYIYSSIGATDNGVSEINTKTGEVRELPKPPNISETTDFLYRMKTIGDGLISTQYAILDSKGRKVENIAIYNRKTNKWTPIQNSAALRELLVDPETNNIYHARYNTNNIYIIDPNKGTSTIDFQTKYPINSEYSLEGITIENDNNPILTLITKKIGKTSDTIIRHSYDMRTKTFINETKLEVSPSDYRIQRLDFLEDNSPYLMISGYQGDGFARLNIDTGKIDRNPKHQGEQIESYTDIDDNTFAFGSYGSARIYTVNKKTLEATRVADLDKTSNQSRPFGLTYANNHLYVGTVSDYGIPGGNLSKIDPKTKKTLWSKPIIENQSIVGLATDPINNNIIYGTTSTKGGLNSDNDTKDGHVFAYNTSTDKILWKTPITNKQVINDPRIVNGKVYTANIQGISVVDAKTGTYEDFIKFNTNSQKQNSWVNTYLGYSEPTNELIYSAMGFTYSYNIETKKHRKLTDPTDPIWNYNLSGMQVHQKSGRIFMSDTGSNIHEINNPELDYSNIKIEDNTSTDNITPDKTTSTEPSINKPTNNSTDKPVNNNPTKDKTINDNSTINNKDILNTTTNSNKNVENNNAEIGDNSNTNSNKNNPDDNTEIGDNSTRSTIINNENDNEHKNSDNIKDIINNNKYIMKNNSSLPNNNTVKRQENNYEKTISPLQETNKSIDNTNNTIVDTGTPLSRMASKIVRIFY